MMVRNLFLYTGLARKEDFPFITYYCPRCHALNRPRNSSPSSPSTSTFDATSPTIKGLELIEPNSVSMKASPLSSSVADDLHMSEKPSPTSSPVGDTAQMSDKVSAACSPVGEAESSGKIVDDGPSSR